MIELLNGYDAHAHRIAHVQYLTGRSRRAVPRRLEDLLRAVLTGMKEPEPRWVQVTVHGPQRGSQGEESGT